MLINSRLSIGITFIDLLQRKAGTGGVGLEKFAAPIYFLRLCGLHFILMFLHEKLLKRGLPIT